MSLLITCPECAKHLQVPENLLGKTVQCPECKHTFTAEEAVSPDPVPAVPAKVPAWDRDDGEAKPRKKKMRDDDVDDRDDEDDDDRPRRKRTRPGRGPDQKPGKVQAIGIMMLMGGIFAVLLALSLGAGSMGMCCLWPGTYYSLVLGIMAIVRASAILGGKAHLETPPTGIAIMHMINIINGDGINLTLGIIIMVFCNDEEVQEYFAK
jgi:hypothetical protein